MKKEESFQIKKPNNFRAKDIFSCGQCFRWEENEDGTYTGIWKENVAEIKEEKNMIMVRGISQSGNLASEVKEYFDLERDYEKLQTTLSQIDQTMAKSIAFGKGIRLLNQDLWETIVSFIISANNNIPRIKGIIKRLAENYGKEIKWQGKSYYTFPTPEELKNVSIEEYRKLGLGFRDKRIYETVQMVLRHEVVLEELANNPETEEVRNELLRMAGVGPKVADCILLFSNLKRWEVFPIDVWVRRVMNDLYFHEPQEEKVSQKQIKQLAEEKFGNLAGLAQQYLFYWRRECPIGDVSVWDNFEKTS